MKHTQGPWVSGTKGFSFPDLRSWQVLPVGTREDQISEDDLQLIAAAPELLAVLTEGAQLNTPDFLDWIAARLVKVHGEDPDVDYVQTLRNRAEQMRAAIRKAEGGAMKPAAAQSRNLRELDKARAGLTPRQQEVQANVLVGALSQLVSPEVWDQALNTTYGYIASCRVKLKVNRHVRGWTCYDDNTYDGPGSILGTGDTEQEAKDDFWGQWKEKRASEVS